MQWIVELFQGIAWIAAGFAWCFGLWLVGLASKPLGNGMSSAMILAYVLATLALFAML